MLILVLDDEPIMLNSARKAVQEAAPDAETLSFSLPADALKAVQERGLSPNVAFVDIEMPGMTGLEFAVRLKTLSPDTRIVFVTAFIQYAYDAFKVRAQGFILKPLSPEQAREELALLPPPSAPVPDKLQIQCFGHFQAYWRGEPLLFGRKQTKELLAFLIDREGATCTAEDISAALWEDDKDMKAVKHRIRTLLSDLRSVLRGIGMEDALVRERRQVAIRRDMVDCDYYRMLAGDAAALNAFHGEYMSEYSWAELSAGRLYFRSPYSWKNLPFFPDL